LKDLINSFNQRERATYNNAFPQLGAGHCNISCSNMASVVWGMTLSKEHFDNFIITFFIIITAGQTVFKTPN